MTTPHSSDCALHNAPACEPGPCDCGAAVRDLISRLEATGPSRELDARIWAENDGRDIVGPVSSATWTNAYFGKSRKPPHDECFLWQSGHVADFVPHYTESMDAALALYDATVKFLGLPAPKRGVWLKLHQSAGPHGSGRTLWHADIWGINGDDTVSWWGIHTSLAIALVIACLRAREAIREDSEAVK